MTEPRVRCGLPLQGVGTVIVGGIAFFATMAPALHAQERVVGRRAVGGGMSYESISFGDGGVPQTTFAGLDSTRLKKVHQFTLPVTAAMPLAAGWRLDVTTLISSGSVEYTDPSAPKGTRSASLSGISDIRLRASGRVIGDGLIVTVGLNVPTGRTELNAGEFATLRVLGSPALGLGSTSVGSGPSGTVGFVVPARAAGWDIAFGGSYEVRGRYQPLAALSAGSASADFTPGGVVRGSVSGDRTVGPHRLIVALSADVFTRDRLASTIAPDASGKGGGSSVADVRLGPVFSADAQLQIAAPRVRELLAYSSYRWRAPFSRDGITVERSSGQYLEAGARTAFALGVGRDLVLSTDARWHSGLGVDLGLPTSGVRSGTVSAGVNLRRSLLAIQPYVRLQGGVLTQQTASGSKPSQSFSGAGVGLVITSRF